jgi:hypothetical protein
LLRADFLLYFSFVFLSVVSFVAWLPWEATVHRWRPLRSWRLAP